MWTSIVKLAHISQLELRAVSLALKISLLVLRHRHILVCFGQHHDGQLHQLPVARVQMVLFDLAQNMPQTSPPRVSLTESNFFTRTAQWYSGHNVKTVHMPRRVAYAPRSGVPDMGKLWQGTSNFLMTVVLPSEAG